MKNILITGISGFIGSRLASELYIKGYKIIGLDLKKPNHDFYNNFFKVDISKEEIKHVDLIDIDIIIHAAAQSGGYKSLIDPELDFYWNCLGSFNISMLAKKLKVKKVVYLSSMAVYGNNSSVSEDSIPEPISFYGASKLSGENYFKVIKEHDNINYIILRLFATYGAGQDLKNMHQGILSIYLSQALKGNIIKITGKKDRIRELVHIKDVINIIIESINTDQLDNQIFNVTNGIPVSPVHIINEISKKLKKTLIIREIDGYLGDQTHIKTLNQNKLSKFNLMPKISLEQGIDEFIKNI
jgi:UDP-glucose 4-epimerase